MGVCGLKRTKETYTSLDCFELDYFYLLCSLFHSQVNLFVCLAETFFEFFLTYDYLSRNIDILSLIHLLDDVLFNSGAIFPLNVLTTSSWSCSDFILGLLFWV